MRMPKPVTFKLNRRPRDPYAASLRGFRGIRFDEKRHALQTLEAWKEIRLMREENNNEDREFDD